MVVSLPTVLSRLYRLESRGVKLGLDRVRAAAARLGNPERRFTVVQIAGTNGKGTVAAILAHAARISGRHVGLFTSPHLHRFSERIRIDGREVEGDLLASHLGAVLSLSEGRPELGLTFFEIATLTAWLVFREVGVELAVLEVGLGGRLDATSAAEPTLTAITSIGLDHTSILGNSLAQIAGEKAGIARQGVPLVVGRLPEEAEAVVHTTAETVGVPLRVLGRDFTRLRGVQAPWPGGHQADNTAIAFELYRLLAMEDEGAARRTFVESLSGVAWPGRFEIIDGSPRFILDCAHNLEASLALVASIRESGERPDVMVFGALRDKPAEEMLEALRPMVRETILVPPPIPRAQDPSLLAAPGDVVCGTVPEGLARARRIAGRDGCVLVTGSIFTVGAARGEIRDEISDSPIGL